MRSLLKIFVLSLTVLVIFAIVALTYLKIAEGSDRVLQIKQCQQITKQDLATCTYIIDNNIMVMKDIDP